MRCPVCKADNTAGSASACRRCKADLSVLHTLENRRDDALDAAARAAEAHDWEAVLQTAGWADHLRRDAMTCQLLALANLMLGRQGEARDWCARWQQVRGE